MSRHLLQLVLRHADGLTTDGSAPDPQLLRRFVASRDEAAFAALVRRHGPMVWAVCRQSVPHYADAEDAFQATFLALAQSAKKIRTPERLAGWLHAAAVRIASKAKRGFTRRTKYERATAKAESDCPVSAAAWNDLLSTVHAEVSALPPSLRAVFVLCDLQGVEPTAAAKQLGLKGGTLSGQLARARQRLLAALAKRGIAAGAVALGTAVTVPEALANKVTGGAGPSVAVIQLASEVSTMTVGKLKLLAAGLLLAGGLTLSGLGLLAKADAQPPGGGLPGGPPSGAPGAGGPRPGAGPGLPGGAAPGGLPGPGGPGSVAPGLPPGGIGAGGGEDGGPSGLPGMGMSGGGPTAAFEYLYVGKPNSLSDVAKVMRDKATKGWEYTAPLDVDPADPPKGKEYEGVTKDTRVVLVFKKKVSGPLTGGGMSMYGPGPVSAGSGGPGGSTPGAGSGWGGGPRGGFQPGGDASGGGEGGRGGPLNPVGGLTGSGPGAGNAFGGGAGAKDESKTVVMKLRNAAAADLAATVIAVYAKTKGVNAVAEPVTNQLIVTAPSDAALKEVEALVAKLDVESGAKPPTPRK